MQRDLWRALVAILMAESLLTEHLPKAVLTLHSNKYHCWEA